MYRLLMAVTLSIGMIVFSGCSKKTKAFVSNEAGVPLKTVTLTIGKFQSGSGDTVTLEDSISTTELNLLDNTQTTTIEAKGADWYSIVTSATDNTIAPAVVTNKQDGPLHKGSTWRFTVTDAFTILIGKAD